MNVAHDELEGREGSVRSASPAVLHVDMDAFYVNVHLLDHPEDAHKPLVVGGRPDQRGVVASASYEARKLGIHSAMPTSKAVRLCPNLTIVPANWKRIRECSRLVMSILAEYGPVEQMSVDEAYVDLSASPDPEAVAYRIPARIKQETQLPCSIGLASTKLVAKVASDYEKPEGLTIVQTGDEAKFLGPMPTRVLWGIGPRTAEKLAKNEIYNCRQLAEADLDLLKKEFGRQAESLQQRARGIDRRQVQSERGMAKSISQEWTFSQDTNDPGILKARLSEMSAHVVASLKNRHLIARTIRVKFRLDDFTTFTRQKSIEVGTDDEEIIYQLALKLWEEHWPDGRKMRLVGVGVSNLEESEGRQLGFEF